LSFVLLVLCRFPFEITKMSNLINRTSLELYRDCLRLVRHIAPGESSKALALRVTVRQQFKLNAQEKNPTKLEELKSNAIRALSNYMLYQSAQKDKCLQQAMNNTNEKNKINTKKKDK